MNGSIIQTKETKLEPIDYKTTTTDLEQLHNLLLSLYKQVKEICDKEEFKLFALGGTLLGAVRHKGFIPWDDDIDVALPRPEYEQFLRIASTKLSEGYSIERYYDKNSSLEFQARVVKDDSEIIVNIGSKPKRIKAFIDVFPLDAMPTNPLLRTLHKYRLLLARMMVRFSMIESVHHTRKRPLYERVLIKFCTLSHLGTNWDTVKLYENCERLCNLYSYEKEQWIVNLFGTYKFKEMFPKEWFGKGVSLDFEDTTVLCPVSYHRVLTQMYGDYMQLPPTEKRGLQHKMEIVRLD